MIAPSESHKRRLLDAFIVALTLAAEEGQRVAGMTQRRSVDSEKSIADRALEIVTGIANQVKTVVSTLFSKIFGSGSSNATSPHDVAQKLADWSQDYANLVATTEIQAAVEESALDVNKQQGATEMYWDAEPDDVTCDICRKNAAASPLPIGSVWPSGDVAPPAHPRCRCSLSYS